jgi:DNA topoisomerase-6 subunit B
MHVESSSDTQHSPTLFDPPPAREIPVTTVRQPAWSAGSDAATKPRSDHATKRPRDEGAPERPVRGTSKRARPVTAETLATQQRDISVSEFFAKNRHLLGFDNKRKALLTTVKEAVDNSLDACEEAGKLPELHVTIDQLAEERFRVTVRDNGPGIVRQQIPNIFGKLLYGSKFHRLKMARGQQGIGISAAGMYGLITTGKSVHITSRTSPKKEAHHFQIQMDTSKNKADVVLEDTVEVPWQQGTEVSIELVATYTKGRQSVDEYIEQTAIANPHALIVYTAPTLERREFPRGTEELPPLTREIKPHPHGIELGVLMKLLKDAKGVKLAGFLQREFCRVSADGATAICERAGLSPKGPPNQIGTHDVERLYEAMQNVKFKAPPTDCLAPIGIRNLLAGLLKEVKAEFFTATTRDPSVYRGNPFQIEVALAYGGNLAGDQPVRVIRFANRVPLLYQQSACAAFKSVMDVDWRNYTLSQPSGSLPVGPLVVMIHMASVWVPFTSESKEAIADYDEIRKEMKLSLQECGRKLAAYVRRRRRQRLESQRRDIFSRYIPDVAAALAALAGGSEEGLLRDLQAIAKRRTADADVVLDEDGKPVAKAAEEEADELTGDQSTVIRPENEAALPVEGLFEESGNGAGSGRRRRRGK